jgi:hypothetical protein
MERMVMRDMEGKALRERATEPGGEGVSIMKDEMKAKVALTSGGSAPSR